MQNTMTTDEHDHRISDALQSSNAIARLINATDTCFKCKQPMEYPPGMPDEEKVPLCSDCDAAAHKAKADREAEQRQRRVERFERGWAEIAGDSADVDPARLPMDSSRSVLTRWSPALRFGVTILGTRPGGSTGRTKTLWGLIRKAYENQKTVICRPAAEFRQLANTLARHGEGAKGIEELVRVGVLGIDDFGLQTFTPASCELFGLILEKRTQHGRPTIVTSPVGASQLGESFAACGAAPAAGPFLRRIGIKHAWTINATDDTLTQPER